jgi:hypothetical protein
VGNATSYAIERFFDGVTRLPAPWFSAMAQASMPNIVRIRLMKQNWKKPWSLYGRMNRQGTKIQKNSNVPMRSCRVTLWLAGIGLCMFLKLGNMAASITCMACPPQ